MSENTNIEEPQTPPFSPPPAQQPAPQTPPRPKSRKGCMILLVVLMVCFVVFGCIAALFVVGFYAAESAFTGMTDVSPFETKKNKFVEELVEGNHFASNKVAVIDIKGVIMNADGGFYQIANSKTICDQLDQARDDSKVKAVILRLDTPGGEVTAADIIHHKVMQLKDENIKVVACMESVAASGGYYIAVASDYIIAHRLTTTGSIGVIIETFNYQSLFNKIGLQAEVYKSGEMKDMLNGARPRTEAEKLLVQNIITEVYDEFVNIVAEGRKSKNITAEQIKTTQIGDGRIFSGKKALELGLVDGVGFFEDAIDKAVDLAKISNNYKVVSYKKVFSFSDFFMSMKGPENKIKIDIPGMKSWTNMLEPGKVYLLPSSGF
ncbi:MAG: signal peptide peptidase SppA [Victivallales bacterium]|jgi:protease-4